MGTPNYVMTKDYRIFVVGKQEYRTIPEGTFVRPIEQCYIPKHTKDIWDKWFTPVLEVYTYSTYGILPIPRKYIRQV